MNYYETSSDSYLARLVDGLVILVLGFAIGIVVSQFLVTEEVSVITTSSQIATRNSKDNDQQSQTDPRSDVDIPANVKLEEN